MAPAYVIANVLFTDQSKAQEYGRQVGGIVGQYGGRYLARGGPAEIAEGAWQTHYLTIVEFDSLEQAKNWYQSPEYAAIKPLRVDNADSQIVFVEGEPAS